jgi:16S rRNA (cytosine1402-N4)-methyltransferase
MSTHFDNKDMIETSTYGSRPMGHIPVLLQESIQYLSITPDGMYADGTLGAAGHTMAIARQLGPEGILVATDLDERSIDHARGIIETVSATIDLVHDSFEALPDHIEKHGRSGYNGILLDLGWNSDQFADPTRGFSFQSDGPLDMRLDTSDDHALTAAEIVNHWSAEDIVDILRHYADERWARRIVDGIIQARTQGSIVSTGQLVEIIRQAIPKKFQHTGIHPATKTFQALRIAVNREFEILEHAVPLLAQSLVPGGRLCIITFHSGEDRIVKHLFRGLAQSGSFSIIEKKGITPSEEELASNPRSRSARLRILEAL